MQFIQRAINWTPRTPIFYGWITLIIAGLGTYGATGSAQVTIAGIQTLIFEDTGWDRSTIAIGVTIGTWTAGFLTPIFGKLVDRQGPRWVMPAASIITGICFIWIGGMNAVWHFYAAYILARGLGNPALIGVVPRTVAVNFFHRKRNLALGIVSMARPCFGAINVQLIALIALWSSWRTAYKLLGAYSILLAIPLLIFMRRRPEDIGLQPDGDIRSESPTRQQSKDSDSGPVPSPSGELSWTTSEAIRSSTLWFVITAEFLVIMTSGTIGFQFVPYLKESGL
ncbi:MAG: MFS transporter, partial [Chloroflexota bacterium]|nr:MFS transporter [Chloroflexota bacterium]